MFYDTLLLSKLETTIFGYILNLELSSYIFEFQSTCKLTDPQDLLWLYCRHMQLLVSESFTFVLMKTGNKDGPSEARWHKPGHSLSVSSHHSLRNSYHLPTVSNLWLQSLLPSLPPMNLYAHSIWRALDF